MKDKNTRRKPGTDWDRLNRMEDSEIDYSEIPELDEDFFRNAEVRLPEPKEAVSLRLDKEVLEWFRGKGRGYQTRINAVLRTYMNACRTRTAPPKSRARANKRNRQIQKS